MKTLFPDQQRAVDLLLGHDRCILRAEAGNGAMMAIAAAMSSFPISERTIIVSPRPLFRWWSDQLLQFAGMTADSGRYFLITPQELQHDYERLVRGRAAPNVVFDDIKVGPVTHDLILQLAAVAKRVWVRPRIGKSELANTFSALSYAVVNYR